MDTIFGVIGLLGALFTGAMTILMLFTFRKERRVNAFPLFFSMVTSLAMLPIFMALSGARLNLRLALPIMALGLLVGFLRGQAMRLCYKGRHVVGRESLLFLLGWGGSLALSQTLNLLGSALLASLGLLPLFLSTGTQVGMNASIFVRKIAMRPPQKTAPIDVTRLGLPERTESRKGLPEAKPKRKGPK